MNLLEILEEKKNQIQSVWIDRTLDSYTSSGFFKKSRDHFANPIGANIRNGLTEIFDLILRKAAIEEYAAPLDQVIRIRAIQDFSPSQAIAPFLELKWVIRQVLAEDKNFKREKLNLSDLELDIDKVALAAFDLYTRCREQLYQVRIQELKSGRHILTDSPCSSKMVRKGKETPSKIN